MMPQVSGRRLSLELAHVVGEARAGGDVTPPDLPEQQKEET
jgi:hypothetical protein